MDFVYDPEAAYNFTSTALLAVIILVGFSSYLSFYMLRVYPNKVKADERRIEQDDLRIENDHAQELARIKSAEAIRLKEVEMIQEQLIVIVGLIESSRDSIHRRFDENEQTTLNKILAHMRADDE